MDKILSLGAFGDPREPEVYMEPTAQQTKTETPAQEENDEYGRIFKMVLQNIVQTKLLHWQCALYGQHKALDGLFEGLIELGDTLAETLMGKYGKPVLAKENLSLNLMNFREPEKGDLSEFMGHLYQCYSVDCRSLLDEKKDTELLNILDEIVGLVDQTKYLISLR